VAAVIVSAVGYLFSLIAILTTIMAFMTVLIGGFNPLTVEKVRHYPHPRPAIEQNAAPTNQEPHHARVTPGTNEATLATDLSAQDQSTKNWRAASATKTDTENRKPERKIKPDRLAHLHQPKVLARQQQNYEGYGYGMALGYAAEGYHPGLDSQR
jgi:hypothetical protein